jgi:hypothetical protein
MWVVAPELNLEGAEWSDSEMSSATSCPARPRPSLPRPYQFSSDGSVVCLGYPQRGQQSVAHAAEERRERYPARLCYYLPEGWSASYKFTVFERSYVVLIGADMPAEPHFGLARPVHPSVAGAAGRGAPGPAVQQSQGAQGGELELVWPMPLDTAVLDAVRGACAVQPRAKRKMEDAGSAEPVLCSVNHKLRKLCV